MSPLRTEAGELVLALKVVPGARRDDVAGPLGERLKVRVSAPPEDGRANRAVCALLARTLRIRESQVRLVSGASNPEKTVRIAGVAESDARRLLGLGVDEPSPPAGSEPEPEPAPPRRRPR